METVYPAILHIIAEVNREPTFPLNPLFAFSLLAVRDQMPGADAAYMEVDCFRDKLTYHGNVELKS